MISSILGGGLGNQMFKIAVAVSLAYDNNDVAIFNFDEYHKCTQGNNPSKYSDNIFRKLNRGILKDVVLYKEPSFNYKKIDYCVNLKLDGIFQTEKYFINNKKMIIDLFEIPDDVKNKLNMFINHTNINIKKTVSLHVRRGDYLNLQNFLPPINIEYINNALDYFQNCFVYILSDDIDWCIDNIKSSTNDMFFIDNILEDYEQLYLMSLCDNNIIANSSFSWWGSYLNDNINKIVIAPKIWFGTDVHYNWNDIYYEKNIII